MPTTSCPDCERPVSDSAQTCPGCGAALLVKVVLTAEIASSLMPHLTREKVQLYLDEQPVGWMTDESHLVFHARPGRHVLKAKRESEWFSRASRPFTANGGDSVEFVVGRAWSGGLCFMPPSAGAGKPRKK